jgi:hypothetical protein
MPNDQSSEHGPLGEGVVFHVHGVTNLFLKKINITSHTLNDA